MKRVQKAGAVLMSALLAFSLYGCTPQQDQQAAFDAFMHDQFVETVQSDYLTAHILLENPQDYDVDMTQIDVVIGRRSRMLTPKNSAQRSRKSVRSLRSFVAAN